MQRPILLNREEAARYIGVRPNTLRVWAYRKDYKIPYRRIGKLVEYLVEDLDKFIADRTKYK